MKFKGEFERNPERAPYYGFNQKTCVFIWVQPTPKKCTNSIPK